MIENSQQGVFEFSKIFFQTPNAMHFFERNENKNKLLKNY